MEKPLFELAYQSQMHIYALRLTPGMDVKEQLDALLKQYAIQAGVVLTCVGSLTNVTLRLANQNDATEWEGHFEIVSLVGTLSVNGSHLHMAVADKMGGLVGGHVLPGNLVYTTAELVIGILPELTFTRESDAATGYNELSVLSKK